MTKKMFIATHGCQMNVYDSQRMHDLLVASHGFEKTDNPADADLLLLNTCSIRAKAEDKVYSEIGRWNKLKSKNPNLVIGVGGCVASQEGENIQQRAPYVDIVFGPQSLHRLPTMLNQVWQDKKAVLDISFPQIEKFDHLPQPKVSGPEAFVSIIEGCSKYCSFCVVPYTRGPEISRPLADVLAEINGLAKRGVREVNLLGQNVNSYRAANGDSTVDLAGLIYHVSNIAGIGRIRYTTSHPVHFDQNLIDAYAELPQLVNHLHLPLQSGSDRILALMKRGHTLLEYKSKIRKLRAVRPDISLSSDFIVGFPGESENDFSLTYECLQELNFDYSFSFLYSARPGTPAANLPDATDFADKKARLQKLQQRINQQTFAISQKMVGQEHSILVSDFSKKNPGQMQGKTENNRVVNFACNDASLIGTFCRVKITAALPNSLRGELQSVIG